MELGLKPYMVWFLGPNSIMALQLDPLGYQTPAPVYKYLMSTLLALLLNLAAKKTHARVSSTILSAAMILLPVEGIPSVQRVVSHCPMIQ